MKHVRLICLHAVCFTILFLLPAAAAISLPQILPGAAADPLMRFAKANPDESITLYFSRPANLSTAYFSVNGMELDLIGGSADGLSATLDSSGLLRGTEWLLTAGNLTDSSGIPAPIHSIPVAQQAEPGDLVINEILYQPIADPRDGIPDQSEYVEIYNRRGFAISLSNLILHDEPDETGRIWTIVPENSEFQWIAANGYAVIYPEPDDVLLSESRTGIYFDLPEQMNPYAVRMNRSTLSLPVGGRGLFLADSDLNVIDSVHYAPEWHNPNRVSVRGVSLERIDPDLPSDDPSNWSSSAANLGGTPGNKNSLYQQPGAVADEKRITLSPNPFSPDDDGFEDRLFITYHFDDPDYLLRVRIFDRYGRLVRNLADNHPAGLNGSLIWDGLMDDGTRNRVGIYIIHLEAFNAVTSSRIVYRDTAVLARRF